MKMTLLNYGQLLLPGERLSLGYIFLKRELSNVREVLETYRHWTESLSVAMLFIRIEKQSKEE